MQGAGSWKPVPVPPRGYIAGEGIDEEGASGSRLSGVSAGGVAAGGKPMPQTRGAMVQRPDAPRHMTTTSASPREEKSDARRQVSPAPERYSCSRTIRRLSPKAGSLTVPTAPEVPGVRLRMNCSTGEYTRVGRTGSGAVKNAQPDDAAQSSMIGSILSFWQNSMVIHLEAIAQHAGHVIQKQKKGESTLGLEIAQAAERVPYLVVVAFISRCYRHF
ncbi:hypothetical protein KL86DPRO_50038 [uncultured delta proteobacterium]|uniref:Uncharacterized protein n=1 Tax=uncultured delta proteobacterium TaxID=34034 RepID=A0A212KBD8_9DELT|nr:hypothetical protein KL86DPRO_50038 [uncultured delta proteobacterium]